jgi:energy-coupling factor transporter ATP-binding protein EcfA2
MTMVNTKIEYRNEEHSYFYSLELEGINGFQEPQILNLSDKEGNYAQWTIILGDNGTGKTTILRILDRMQPTTSEKDNLPTAPFLMLRYYFEKVFKSKEMSIKLNIEKSNISNKGIGVKFNDEEGKASFTSYDLHTNIFLISYGASRRMNSNPYLSTITTDELKMTSLFDESIELINVEEWYLQKDFAVKSSTGTVQQQLNKQLDLIKEVLVDFLPEVLDLRSKEIKTIKDTKPTLEVKIGKNTWINLRDLSYGYQTTTALLVDIASKMMERYPESENPLHEPVIILIDEIDLHLHPKWQRTVVDKLTKHFSKAQFIVTAHSPLIVQAAEDKNANIVVCRKESEKILIDNSPESVKGWRVDQILTSDLFGVASSQSLDIEDLKNEKTRILLNDKLSEDDNIRLNEINNVLEKLPIFSGSKENLEAEELIRKAAQILKK